MAEHKAPPAYWLDGSARAWNTGVKLPDYRGPIDAHGALFDLGTDRSTGERTWTCVDHAPRYVVVSR